MDADISHLQEPVALQYQAGTSYIPSKSVGKGVSALIYEVLPPEMFLLSQSHAGYAKWVKG